MHKYKSKISPKSWIDDLPVCKKSGIGFSSNQIYMEDGNRHEEHPYEDRSFHCRSSIDANAFLYGVFDGFNGTKAVDFCLQKLPAEILFAQLHASIEDEDVKGILRQAFLAVENGYMEVIDDLLAQRMSYDIPMSINLEEYCKSNDFAEIEKINSDISCGATVAVALIYYDKLYTANVGNCRILLCETDAHGVLKVRQLSVDHDMSNEDELFRLQELGLDINNLQNSKSFGNQDVTRCIGNYLVKGGYKENSELAGTNKEPAIAEPEVIGGIKLIENHQFLLLMSSGFCKAAMEAKGPEDTNRFIAQSVVEQFRKQSTITGVAQAVVDQIVRLHHDWYSSHSASYEKTREDITLVVRNFNFPMPNAIQSLQSSPMNSNIGSSQNTIINSSLINSAMSNATLASTNNVEVASDPNKRIKAYVDFKDFYVALEKAVLEGKAPFKLG